MATSIEGQLKESTVQEQARPETGFKRRRRISPRAGRALEILGHAIDYLADDYVQTGKTFSANDPQVKAIQLLMALNREVYLECPVVATLAERVGRSLRGFLG
jgi:hypothetical protein